VQINKQGEPAGVAADIEADMVRQPQGVQEFSEDPLILPLHRLLAVMKRKVHGHYNYASLE
jgi:hypothetical protein